MKVGALVRVEPVVDKGECGRREMKGWKAAIGTTPS